MLETIITEAIWVYFHEHSRFTGQPGEGGGYLFNSSWGKHFWTYNLWVGYSKWLF